MSISYIAARAAQIDASQLLDGASTPAQWVNGGR